MDFLEIRKKAKERKGGRPGDAAPAVAAPAAPERAAAGETSPQPGELPSADASPVAERDVVEGEPAVGFPGLSATGDARFATWRPSSGGPQGSPKDRAQESPLQPAGSAPDPAPTKFSIFNPGEWPAPEHGSPFGDAIAPSFPPSRPADGRSRLLPLAATFDEFFYRPDEEAPDLPALGAEAVPIVAADPERAQREEFLTFRLEPEEYAVKIEQVREVLKAPPITEVPRAPAHILGVVTVRGEVVTVFDPRRRLGLPPASSPERSGGRVIIVDAGEGPCGLLVDAVASVVRLKPGSIEPCPQGVGGASADCLAGIGRDRDRLFTVLELGALLRRVPARSGAAGGLGPEREGGGRAHGGA
jgi:purine-binding chemotaxis protein CheW